MLPSCATCWGKSVCLTPSWEIFDADQSLIYSLAHTYDINNEIYTEYNIHQIVTALYS